MVHSLSQVHMRLNEWGLESSEPVSGAQLERDPTLW